MLCFQAAHPNPGEGYQAARLTGWLTDDTEGKDVLRRLEKAFRMRILVTVRDGEISWNGVDLSPRYVELTAYTV